ncbi:hypothetical protein AB0M20_03315 [Actinoplanes sp. NPDC051633]|uniref:hypothetical protein n=1 Tax=Actinoplanes sp. NPDC051633 TaxID=3155670 RepID=UPI00343E00B7
MSDSLVGVGVVACVAVTLLVVVLALVGARGQRRRRERMRVWGERNGWTYSHRPGVDWGRHLPGGNRNGVEDLFTAVIDGRRVNVGEYSVTDAATENVQNTHFWVVSAAALGRPLPAARLEPRGAGSRIKQKMLGPGATATGHPEFDRRFRIETDMPAVVGRWFSAPLILAQLNGQAPPSWSVYGTELLCHRPGRLDLNEISAHAASVVALAYALETGSD